MNLIAAINIGLNVKEGHGSDYTTGTLNEVRRVLSNGGQHNLAGIVTACIG